MKSGCTGSRASALLLEDEEDEDVEERGVTVALISITSLVGFVLVVVVVVDPGKEDASTSGLSWEVIRVQFAI